jgi:hypothetical protein
VTVRCPFLVHPFTRSEPSRRIPSHYTELLMSMDHFSVCSLYEKNRKFNLVLSGFANAGQSAPALFVAAGVSPDSAMFADISLGRYIRIVAIDDEVREGHLVAIDSLSGMGFLIQPNSKITAFSSQR